MRRVTGLLSLFEDRFEKEEVKDSPGAEEEVDPVDVDDPDSLDEATQIPSAEKMRQSTPSSLPVGGLRSWIGILPFFPAVLLLLVFLTGDHPERNPIFVFVLMLTSTCALFLGLVGVAVIGAAERPNYRPGPIVLSLGNLLLGLGTGAWFVIRLLTAQ